MERRSYAELIKEVSDQVEEAFPWDILDQVESGAEPLLVDIRCPHEFEAAHIAGSIVSFRQGCMNPRPRSGTVVASYLATRRPHDVTVTSPSHDRSGGDGCRFCPLARYHSFGCADSRSAMVAGG